jgi:DNA (cytosine-5)-methyltransferase 1
MMPSVVDLFAGAGGLSLGFRAAGCRILAAIDRDEVAARTFRENFTRLQAEDPPMVIGGEAGDLERPRLSAIVDRRLPDILVGGPPCQGFSRLGRAKINHLNRGRHGDDPRNALYRTFLDATKSWRPRAFVMENVPGMLSVGGVNVAADVGAELATIGYRVGYAVLNAVWYGVPQFRERLFFIGIREDIERRPTMPLATHRADLPSGYLRPSAKDEVLLPIFASWLAVDLGVAILPATIVSEALDDLPVLTDHLSENARRLSGDFRRPLPYRGPAHSPYASLMRNWPGFPSPATVSDHVVRRTRRDYETFRRMRPGDRYPQAIAIARQRLTEEIVRQRAAGNVIEPGSTEEEQLIRLFLPPYPEDMFVDKWRKLLPDQPSWTVPAHLSKDTYSHIHHDSEQARMISPREAARLQSFPDAFTFAGNMGDCFRQIGNAVPPLLAWAIAATVLDLLGIEGGTPVPWAMP